TDPSSVVTTTACNASGDPATVTNAAGTATYAYNASNEVSTDGLHSASYTYFPNGQIHTMADNSGTTTYAYNTRDKLSSVTNGAGYTLTYGYDDAGNPTSIIYPDGNTVTRTYDDQNRMAS